MSEIELRTIEKHCRFVFAHGWAMQNSFFDPLIARLDIESPLFSSRDYFNTGAATNWFEALDGNWIGIGHSFGFLRLVSDRVPGCKALISLNGFTDFCGAGGTDRKILDRMQRKLQDSPAVVVSDFLQRCGTGVFENPDSFNVDLLSQDLARLADYRMDSVETPMKSVNGTPVLALASADDPIVPLKLSYNQFDDLHVCPGGRHVLGKMFGYWCSLHIQTFLSTHLSGSTQV